MKNSAGDVILSSTMPLMLSDPIKVWMFLGFSSSVQEIRIVFEQYDPLLSGGVEWTLESENEFFLKYTQQLHYVFQLHYRCNTISVIGDIQLQFMGVVGIRLLPRTIAEVLYITCCSTEVLVDDQRREIAVCY